MKQSWARNLFGIFISGNSNSVKVNEVFETQPTTAKKHFRPVWFTHAGPELAVAELC
jgi:hypothetical protein